MILTVTLNAALDRTLAVPSFEVGFRHRSTETYTLPGGKGVNVARVVKTLGQPVIATGFAGGRTGDRIVADLNHEGILCDFVAIDEESRTSTAVLDPTTGTATEINEYGPEISEHELDLMREKLDYLAKAADLVVLAGSLPLGVDSEIYRELVGQLRSGGLTVFLDTSGEPLRQGIRGGPDAVFPNQVEAEMVVGHEFSDDDDLMQGAGGLRNLGAGSAVITHREGCTAQIAVNGGVVQLHGRAPEVEAVSSIGSGDSLVGGYAAAMIEGRSPTECLRTGLACAAANTLRYGAGVFSESVARRLREETDVKEVARR